MAKISLYFSDFFVLEERFNFFDIVKIRIIYGFVDFKGDGECQ